MVLFRGHITICKVYSDGTEEKVLDNANLITAGLGSAFIDIQRGAGSMHSIDYAPHYFQLGTSDIGYNTTPARQASSTFYQLSAPLDWSAYGDDTDFIIVKRYRGFNASTEDTVGPPKRWRYTELLNTSAALSSVIFSGADQYFSIIKDRRITKYHLDTFESEIIVDENTGNGQTISEVGLFAKNPKGLAQDSPFLMAYRNFTGIPKTKDFSIVIHWIVGFVGLSAYIDNYFTGGDGDDPRSGGSGGTTPTGGRGGSY